MERPKDNDKCASCKHMFLDHYVSFNHEAGGCTYTADYRLDPKVYKCRCKGFTIIYRGE